MNLSEFVEAFTFPATFQRKGGDPDNGTLEVRFAKYDPSGIEVKGVLTDQEYPNLVGILSDPSHTDVWGELGDGRVLRLIQPSIKRQKGREVDLYCSGFTLGNSGRLPFESGNYSVSVSLPHTSLVRIPKSTVTTAIGTLEFWWDKRNWEEGIRWDSRLGEFLTADFYSWERDVDKRIETRIEIPTILLRGKVGPQTETESLVAAVEEEIQNPVWLISFLSRKFVYWYKIEATFIPEEHTEYRPASFLKRVTRLNGGERQVEPIVLQHHLCNGEFAALLNNLGNSDMKEALILSMVYCVSSYHQATIDTELSAIYLAIESLTGGFARQSGSTAIFAGDVQEQFRRVLRRTIQEFCDSKHVEGNIYQQLEARVDGFDSTSLKHRILSLLENAGISVEDLWPRGFDLKQEIQNIVFRRNNLIHRGQLESDFTYHVKDLARLRVITERCILSLLGWDLTKLSPAAYSTFWLR